MPTLVPMEEITSLEPGQIVKRTIHVRFYHHLLPLKLALLRDGKRIPVKLRPDIGYFVKPLPMRIEDFSDKESRLRGMFEYIRRLVYIFQFIDPWHFSSPHPWLLRLHLNLVKAKQEKLRQLMGTDYCKDNCGGHTKLDWLSILWLSLSCIVFKQVQLHRSPGGAKQGQRPRSHRERWVSHNLRGHSLEDAEQCKSIPRLYGHASRFQA